MLKRCFGMIFLAAAVASLDAGEALTSGPQKGELLPGPFAPLNINGKHKGKHHCLLCEYGFNPLVLVFAREPAEGKDEALTKLLKELEKAVVRLDNADFKCFVVFLSQDAHSSVTAPDVEDPGKLVDEAKAHEDLAVRLKARAENLNKVVITCYPAEGPKGYKINSKAELTVLFCNRLQVVANFSYHEGQFQLKDVEAIVQKVDATLAQPKKKPAKDKLVSGEQRSPLLGELGGKLFRPFMVRVATMQQRDDAAGVEQDWLHDFPNQSSPRSLRL